MSKAFLRESDEAEPELPTPVATLPPGARNYLTADGAARLREQLRRLRLEQRPEIAARASGDPEARAQLAVLDQRIRTLQQSLFAAEIVTNAPGPTDIVRFGTRVTVRDSGGQTSDYRLVGVDESDPGSGAISWISPFAQALMHATVGDRVQVSTPAGVREITVTRIRCD